MVHWLYVSIIWLSIIFASLVWWPGCQTAGAQKRLSRLKKLTCLGIVGAMPTTPTGAMEAFTGLPSLLRRGKRHIVSGVWDFGPAFTPV